MPYDEVTKEDGVVLQVVAEFEYYERHYVNDP